MSHLVHQRLLVSALLIAVAICLSTFDVSSANAQGQDVRKLQTAVKKAAAMVKAGKAKAVADNVAKFQNEFERLASMDAAIAKRLKPTHDDFKKVFASLELEGFELPVWKELPIPKTPGGLSFVKDVAPILSAKCGRCHVEKTSGEVNFKSYSDLRSTNGGLLVFPGEPKESQLIDVIASGEMPKGGLKITKEEMTTLAGWIKEGAKFDGDDPGAMLAGAATSTTPMAPAAITKSTGKETVSFAMDIAPVLIENCNGCHYNPRNNAQGNFNMTNFMRLARGGNGGAPFVAGDPAMSAIISRLKSTGADRMPQGGRGPLPADVIAKIEKWITEGATFDSSDPNENLQTVYATARATRSTHEELMAERIASSQQNWRLGMPNVSNSRVESDNFLVMGDAPRETLESVSKSAEKISPRIARMFRTSTKDPLVKGRITLFVFTKRYDYSEFGKMVEQRTLPPEWRGHWRYDVINAYGAILPDRNSGTSEAAYDNDVLIAQQIAGVYASSIGKEVPRWYAEGAARVAAANAGKKDPRVLAWESSLAQVRSRMKKPDDFITGQLSTEDADIMSYKFVESLMKNSSRHSKLLKGLRAGYTFEQVFLNVYGGTPSQAAAAWLR